MSKRFTDTEKWGKRWYRHLSPVNKLIWVYILDKCDNAGVIDIDKELAEFVIGAEIDWNEVEKIMEKQIIILENGKWWIRDFIRFQYGDELRESNRPQKYVMNLLKMHGLYDIYMEYQNNEFREDLKEIYDRNKGKENGKKRITESESGIKQKIEELKHIWNEQKGIRHYTKSEEFDKKIKPLLKKYKIEELKQAIIRFGKYHQKSKDIEAEIKRGNEVDHFKRYIESWMNEEEFENAVAELIKWNKDKKSKKQQTVSKNSFSKGEKKTFF